MLRYCANCGTEVDETAVFCPTCGQPIEQDGEAEIPPAPSWPDPEPERPEEAPVASAPPRPDNFRDDLDDRPRVAADGVAAPQAPVDSEEPTRVERRPEPEDDDEVASPPAFRADDDEPVNEREDLPPARAGSLSERFRERAAAPPDDAPGPPATTGGPPVAADVERRRAPGAGSRPDLPITMPVTLSAWLIGGGAAIAGIGALFALFDGLGSAVDLLLLVTLLGVAATIFLASRLPAIPQLRVATLVVVLVALGVALDRLGFGRAGAGELLLFLGTAAAAMGAILVETGNDQPLGGPSA